MNWSKREFGGIHPAFPVGSNHIQSEWNGLSKREYIATALLSGLLGARRPTSKGFDKLAQEAIQHADELITLLQAESE